MPYKVMIVDDVNMKALKKIVNVKTKKRAFALAKQELSGWKQEGDSFKLMEDSDCASVIFIATPDGEAVDFSARIYEMD